MDLQYVLAAVIAIAFVLFIGGKYWKLKKEITEFVDAIAQASADGSVSEVEMARIIKEGKDIGRTLKEITLAVLQIIPKK